MKKILVLVEKYPSKYGHDLMYVHVRNLYYKENGFEVEVLNFNAKENYEYEGIKVYTLDFYQKNQEKMKYEILILHAANLKNHYKFLRKYETKFSNIIFFYHGHEILKITDEYPEEYFWIKKKAPDFVRNIYDKLKFFLWRNMLKKILYKSHLVFVSHWLYHRFLYNIHICPKLLDGKVSIIHNSVGKFFELNKYNKSTKKKYDYITIRGNGLDGSKYGVDIVVELAKRNPNRKFLIIGKGNFFNHYEQPANVTFINQSLNHQEMKKYLDASKCALLPTREDTQGVMTCEMFTYGIPTITSNIEVCREIFGTIKNVALIDNSLNHIDLDKIYDELSNAHEAINEKYYQKNTIEKEINLLKE